MEMIDFNYLNKLHCTDIYVYACVYYVVYPFLWNYLIRQGKHKNKHLCVGICFLLPNRGTFTVSQYAVMMLIRA